jgi:tyrosyl-tRNA synthetase
VIQVPPEKQVERVLFGAEFGDRSLEQSMRRELTERIEESFRTQRPLRVYAGYDPSRPDLHLGHTITLRKLREFQDFGHDVTFVVGTFTAQVGDTSDKLSGRPRKTLEEVREAARTYADQCYRVLDPDRTEVVYNADWLAGLTLADVISTASHFTVQQFLVRDNYRQRIDRGDPVGLHEFMYALLQGYDAVHLRCDVQLGATEQLFNILAGRKLQQALGQRGLVALTYPILLGTDGTLRMSKSTGNYVGIAEPAEEQFGKVMSISDETMLQWVKYVTRWSPGQIHAFIEDAQQARVHPMELKKSLAAEIVSMYHGDAAAHRARAHFESVHQKGQTPDDVPVFEIAEAMRILELLVASKLAPSKGEARRLIEGGGVRVDQQTVSGLDAVIERSGLVQVGKRRFLQVTRKS